MEYPGLEDCALFAGVPAGELREELEAVPHGVRHWERGEAVFRLMEPADWVGIVLRGRVQAQKPFPNGSQINVSVRGPGEMIGSAAAFSRDRRYPCDAVALESSEILMFRREDILRLMQRNIRILENFTTGIATATAMLQQRLELLSYGGIGQKAAFYLLVHARQSGGNRVRIPESVANWAMVMNVSRPSLHRELKKLEGQGIIAYAPPFVEILDPEALEDVLSCSRGSSPILP